MAISNRFKVNWYLEITRGFVEAQTMTAELPVVPLVQVPPYMKPGTERNTGATIADHHHL